MHIMLIQDKWCVKLDSVFALFWQFNVSALKLRSQSVYCFSTSHYFPRVLMLTKTKMDKAHQLIFTITETLEQLELKHHLWITQPQWSVDHNFSTTVFQW